MNFEPILANEQAIHGKVKFPNQQEVFISFVYGMCDSRIRKQLWADILYCANRFRKSPWILVGDFNVTRSIQEHNNNDRITKAMEDFNSTIRAAELEDLKTTGLKFTWNNMRSGSAAISKKLDRTKGNWQWFKCFGDSYVHVYSPGISDHSPMSIQLMQQVRTAGRPFKFLNFWADQPEFLSIVREEWAKTYKGSLLKIVQLKLKGLKSRFKCLHTRPDLLAADLRLKLKEVQVDLDGRPEDCNLKNQEIWLRHELFLTTKKEEAFFKQKSRIQWLKEGDSNTAFFHRAVNVRQSKNHITRILTDQGSWLESVQDIAQEGVKCFKNLFDKHQRHHIHQVADYPKRLTSNQSRLLGSPVTRAEVETTFSSMNPNKAGSYNGIV
ncbi:Exo_endo_phos domain-containing protein [Cephalotus follicularis]|uniref:Exo_endo_phos domain-containing protein n=1 Tax=Cephalotus follicularis TaxID=3775 RepID=A0A1Q3C1P0_CEPFO|nr:Exo_endo_phos domain-containing protein [Cephalotus follicularis]